MSVDSTQHQDTTENRDGGGTGPEVGMNETQASIGQWLDATLPGADPTSPRQALRCLQECVELCLASGASSSEIYDAISQAWRAHYESKRQGYLEHRPQPDKVPGEAADVFIVLAGLAHTRNFDLQQEVGRKMAVNRQRRWKANGDGTGQHCPQDKE
jgi:hypothetical protein